MKKNYKVSENEGLLRIDKFLSLKEEKFSRAYFSNLIKSKNVLVNGSEISPSYKIKVDDHIEVNFVEDEIDETIKPLDLKLDIVYSDDDLLVINKPRGLVVHPGDGHHDDTLVNALVFANIKLSDVNGLKRIGIVHRIDKDTTGALLICKNNYAHNFIAEQLKDHDMHREYYALVMGNISEEKGTIIAPIGRDKQNRKKMCVDSVNGKKAITHFEVVERFEKFTLISCKLETGRTHQIRVHMEYINHPVVGDPLYGKNNCHLFQGGQLLHAYKLTFMHPTLKKEITVSCPLPSDFENVLNKLR